MATAGGDQTSLTLIRRDFNSEAEVNIKATVALTIISVIAVVGLLGTTIWVTIRAAGYRTPLVALAISALCFALGQITRAAAIVNAFTHENYTAHYRLVGAQISMEGIAFATVIAAAMFTLWNRGSAASAQSTFYPPRANSRGITLKRAFDTLFLVAVACMAIGRAAAFGQVGYFDFLRDVVWDFEILAYVFGWCYAACWGVFVINIAATGFTIRTRIWRTYNNRDKPTDAVVWGVWPCMLLYWGWILFRSFFFDPYLDGDLVLIDVILASVFYAGMSLSILIPGFKPHWWDPLVAKPHQNWIGVSHYVGPSLQPPIVLGTLTQQQTIAVQPQLQYASVGTMMQVPVQGGYIQGHFVPTTADQNPMGPSVQPASDPLRSPGT